MNDSPYQIEVIPFSKVPRTAKRTKYEWLYKRILRLTPGDDAILVILPNRMEAKCLAVIACGLNRTHTSEKKLARWKLPPNQHVATRAEPIEDTKKCRLFIWLETRNNE